MCTNLSNICSTCCFISPFNKLFSFLFLLSSQFLLLGFSSFFEFIRQLQLLFLNICNVNMYRNMKTLDTHALDTAQLKVLKCGLAVLFSLSMWEVPRLNPDQSQTQWSTPWKRADLCPKMFQDYAMVVCGGSCSGGVGQGGGWSR